MSKQRIKATQLLVLLVFTCAFIIGSFITPGIVAEAAAKKASISATKLTIPLGKMDSKVYWNTESIWEFGNAQKLAVNNKVKGATYKFTSSNSKVVTIAKDGGYLTGVKAGTATITCTQTLNKKTTTVGKCSVTVKSAKLVTSEYTSYTLPEGSGQFNLYDHYAYGNDPLFMIAYRNPKATYSVTSSSKDFTIKAVKQDASKVKSITDEEFGQEMLADHIGKRYFYGYEYTAKKAGTYKITIKETYNKKTKTLGSFTIEIKETSIAEAKVDVLLNDTVYLFSLLNYTKPINYYFDIKDFDEANLDNNILTFTEDGYYLYANKAGTTEVSIREESKEGKLIGTVTFVVAEAPCQGITLEQHEVVTSIDEADYFYLYYETTPERTTDKVFIESDNPEVLKVEYDEEYQYWIFNFLKVGEANLTYKCGDFSDVCKVTIVDDAEDDDYE